MAVFDDDPFAAPKKQAAHEIGEPLDSISVEELGERIELLRQEIARLEAALTSKQATKSAAESFFRT
ncbi:MAG: DUF1192 domain-containing protein [Hyphomicrobiales bacterium]|nr:DUF1192 domain-containing protein [Hyphomicrobiales bacterium]